MAHWPAYMYRQELIELYDFEGHDVELWVTRRGGNGDVYLVCINNIARDIPHCITDDDEAIGYVSTWLKDVDDVKSSFHID